jgi:hypothetical protein
MTDLTEFLLARIAEDEAQARECSVWVENAPSLNDCAPHHNPARLLVECETRRRIVEHVEPDLIAASAGDPYVLQLLVLPYSDHPDYRQEWKP